MKLRPVFLFAGALTLVTGCFNSGKNIPLKVPEAPFVKKEMAGNNFEILNSKGKIKGNKIVFGNKQIMINPRGGITFTTEAGTAKIPFYFHTDAGWVSTAGRTLKPESFKFSEKSNTYVYKGKFPLLKEKGKTQYGNFIEKLKLLENGKVKLSFSWDSPENTAKNIKAAGLFIKLPSTSLQGEKVRFKGKDYLIELNSVLKEKTGSPYILCAKVKDPVEFFPGNPSKSFSVKPIGDYKGMNISYGSNGLSSQVQALPGEGKFLFELDCRESVQPEISLNEHAGVDFMKVEALEMPDYKNRTNKINNPSFEQDLNYFDIEHKYNQFSCLHDPEKYRWTIPFDVDNTEAKFGRKSLEIKTNLKTKSYRGPLNLTAMAVPLPKGTYTLSFYAKGNRPGKQELSFWIPNPGWTKGSVYAAIPGGTFVVEPEKEWKRFKKTIHIPSSMATRLAIHAGSSTEDGSVWVDGIQFEKGSKATAFSEPPIGSRLITSSPENFLEEDQKINARLELSGKPGAKGKVKLSVKDFFSNKLFEETFPFEINKDSFALINLPFENKFPVGIFVCKAEYELEGGTKGYDFFRFSIMDFLESKHRLKKMFSISYGDKTRDIRLPEILKRWKHIGVGACSHAKRWDKPVTDLYAKAGIEFSDIIMGVREHHVRPEGFNYHKLNITPQDSSKIRYLMDYRYQNPNNTFIISGKERVIKGHSNKNAELTDEYLKCMYENVKKAATGVPPCTWLLGGEIAKYQWKPEVYAKLVETLQKAVKAANPANTVCQGDPCNMRPDMGIKELGEQLDILKGRVSPDYVGIHPYRYSPENPDLDSDTRELLKMMDEKGFSDTPVLWGEGMHYGPYEIPQWGIRCPAATPPAGWHCGAMSYDMGWTEKKSATWCARSWLVALKYQDRIKNACSGTFSSNFTMDFYMTPFAMQKITNTLSHLLGDAYFKKDIRFAPYTRCYIFEDAEKRPVAAVWNHHPELDAGTLKAPEAEANFKGETPQIFDLMGAQRLVKTEENGNIRFPVSSFPLFFRGKKNSLDNFIKAFTNASLVSGKGFLPVTMNGRPVSPDKLRMLFKNMCSKIFEGKLEYGKTSKTISVPSKGTASINIAMPETLTGNKIIKERIPVKLLRKNGTGKFEFDSSFRGFLCGKTNSEITIDGKLDDWKDIPEIKFKNRYISSRSLKEGIKDIENDDFSGSFKCAWNEKGLYLAVIINDNKFYHKEYEKTGRRWDNDSLQVYFDTLCDARLRDKNAYDENDYDYAVFPSSDGKSSIAYRYYSPDIQLTLGTAAPRDKSIAPEIKTAFKLSGEGYVYEAFFPARYILPIQLKKGYALGFGLFVNDADEPKAIKSSRHISTRSSLTLAPEGKGCYNKPKGWPVMLLWE